MASKVMPARTYSMAELSRISGLSPRTIRRCIEVGLVSRSSGATSGARYNERQKDRVIRIRELIDHGMTLKKIQRQLLSEAAAPSGTSLRVFEEQVRRDVGIGPGVVIGFVGERHLTADQQRRFLERVRKAYEEIVAKGI